MSSRDNRTRKRGRKARKIRDEDARRTADEAYAEERRLHPTPVNESRIHQIFMNMSFRSHEKGGTKPFKNFAFGPTVEASTPQELEDATNEFYVRSVLEKPEN